MRAYQLARDLMTDYEAAAPVLGVETISDRLSKLEEIRRLLLAIIPRERNRLIRPAQHDPVGP